MKCNIRHKIWIILPKNISSWGQKIIICTNKAISPKNGARNGCKSPKVPKSHKTKNIHFWATRTLPMAHLTPKSDSVPKITIEMDLRSLFLGF